MKQFLIFITLLVSSCFNVLACGYTPYGEDVRYCLFKPEYFNFSEYGSFNYTANLYGFDFAQYDKKSIIDANILDWYLFTNKKVSIKEIQEFNDKLNLSDIQPKSDNKFIKFLYQNHKNEAIAYLKTAKNCEAINNFIYEDVWERNETVNNKERLLLLNKLNKILQTEKNQYFKRKYAFLSIRLAHYAEKNELIKEVFETYFENTKKDYLYYWSSFFYTFTKWDGKAMVRVANLMDKCPKKIQASYYYFHDDFKIEEALLHSVSNEEIAAIYGYASVQKVDKNLEYLKLIFTNNSKSSLLDFLLLREINKIEDWIYTPYYSNYAPTTFEIWNSTDKITTETLRNRSERDRLYAQEVLDFINSIDYNKTKNPPLWQAAQINLQFITRKYDECIANIALFEKHYKSEKVFEEIEKIKALCITANQEEGKAIVKPEVEPIILKYKNDQRFVFALGRELEFKGNVTDGIALISYTETVFPKEFSSDDVEWQGNRLKNSGNLEVFYSYFDYLDFVYSAKDLQVVLNKLKSNNLTQFQSSIYKGLFRDKDYLTDLLGTKYIRENQFSNALITFKSLGNKYWEENYNPWERGRYGQDYSFEQNPFYDFKYTNNFIVHNEKFIVTKVSITEHLIKFTNFANNPKTKDRDYYYFLLGNCYYNMSDYGNSWLMRRYYNTTSYWDEFANESYIDEIEYRNKIKSVENYQLAFLNAKTPKFKALCLRMMDYAEKHTFSTSKRVDFKYPEYSQDLSGCENLVNFFNSRR